MKYIAIIFFAVSVYSISSCSLNSSLDEFESLRAEKDSLRSAIAKTKGELRELEKEIWKTLYETEFLRNAVVKADADSVKEFYHNYVFNFRRPIEAFIEMDPKSPFRFPLNAEMEEGLLKFRIQWGRLFYFDFNHLGMDIRAREGDTVRAIYDGFIQNYSGAEGYGDLVVVVEHEYRESWNKTAIPITFLSIYGHVRSYSQTGEAPLKLQPGTRVKKGDVIAFINDDQHNGYGREHLHLGIRIQSAKDAMAIDNGYWMRGYDTRNHSRFQFFMNPVELFGRYVKFNMPEYQP